MFKNDIEFKVGLLVLVKYGLFVEVKVNVDFVMKSFSEELMK